MEPLKKVLKEVRKSRNLTQGQVAYKADTAREYVSQLESGARDNPSAELLARIAVALGTTPDYVLKRMGLLPSHEDPLSPEVQQLRDVIESYPDGPMKDQARAAVVHIAKTLESVLQTLDESEREPADEKETHRR